MQVTSKIFFLKNMAFVLGLYFLYQQLILAVACFYTDNFTFWIENMLFYTELEINKPVTEIMKSVTGNRIPISNI